MVFRLSQDKIKSWRKVIYSFHRRKSSEKTLRYIFKIGMQVKTVNFHGNPHFQYLPIPKFFFPEITLNYFWCKSKSILKAFLSFTWLSKTKFGPLARRQANSTVVKHYAITNLTWRSPGASLWGCLTNSDPAHQWDSKRKPSGFNTDAISHCAYWRLVMYNLSWLI